MRVWLCPRKVAPKPVNSKAYNWVLSFKCSEHSPALLKMQRTLAVPYFQPGARENMEELEEGLKVVGARGDKRSMPKGSCAGPESMSTALECMSSSSHLAFVNHVTVGNRLTSLSLVLICPLQW